MGYGAPGGKYGNRREQDPNRKILKDSFSISLTHLLEDDGCELNTKTFRQGADHVTLERHLHNGRFNIFRGRAKYFDHTRNTYEETARINWCLSLPFLPFQSP